jgi:hypothetical protein
MSARQLSRKANSHHRKRSMRQRKQLGGNLITIKLFDHVDQETSVQIEENVTVLQLKEKIAETHQINNVDNIQLFLDNELLNKNLLSKYHIKDNSELSLVVFDENATEEEDDDYDDEDD